MLVAPLELDHWPADSIVRTIRVAIVDQECNVVIDGTLPAKCEPNRVIVVAGDRHLRQEVGVRLGVVKGVAPAQRVVAVVVAPRIGCLRQAGANKAVTTRAPPAWLRDGGVVHKREARRRCEGQLHGVALPRVGVGADPEDVVHKDGVARGDAKGAELGAVLSRAHVELMHAGGQGDRAGSRGAMVVHVAYAYGTPREVRVNAGMPQLRGVVVKPREE